jgi:hypothetical protein
MMAVVACSFGCTESEEPAGPTEKAEDAGGAVDASLLPVRDAALDAARVPAEDASSLDATVTVSLDAQVDARTELADASVAQDARTTACSAVDVVWIQDSSGSVLHAQSAMQANFEQLMRRIEQDHQDLNVILLAEAIPFPGLDAGVPPFDAGRIHHVLTGVDSKMLLTLAIDLFPSYASYLRPGAATHIVAITDDNDVQPAAQFKAEMEGLLGHGFTFHAVASESVNGSPCISEDQLWNELCVSPIPAVCGASTIGTNYYELAAQTGGEQVSICKHAWTPLLDRLAATACP